MKMIMTLMMLLAVPSHSSRPPRYVDAARVEAVRIGYSGVTVILTLDRRVKGDNLRIRAGKWHGRAEPMRQEVGVIVRDCPALIPYPQPGEMVHFYEGG